MVPVFQKGLSPRFSFWLRSDVEGHAERDNCPGSDVLASRDDIQSFGEIKRSGQTAGHRRTASQQVNIREELFTEA